MRYSAVVTIALIGLAPVPTPAQEAGSDLMRRGMELFLEGLQDELSPTLREFADLAAQAGPALQGFLEEMGPAFAEVLNEVKDWSMYHPPEILPNGDIIMRRRQPAEPAPDADDGATPPAEGQIDL